MASPVNKILRRLGKDDLSALRPHLSETELDLRQALIVPGEPISHVWFPESGLISIVAGTGSSDSIEVGHIGSEGMTDHVLSPGDISILQAIVQVPGSALVATAEAYARWIMERPGALRLITRYQQFMTVQLAYTALSHGSFTIEERLARWLLMCFDRLDGSDLPLVHDFIARMLAVRRAGVTGAIHMLESHGAIRATRGLIHLQDREQLVHLAGGSYGVPEMEYERLMSSVP